MNFLNKRLGSRPGRVALSRPKFALVRLVRRNINWVICITFVIVGVSRALWTSCPVEICISLSVNGN